MPTLALSRRSFPVLLRAGGHAPLHWNHGELYNALLSSSMMRIGERGLAWCQTCELPHDWLLELSGREHVACNTTRDALCTAHDTQHNVTMRLFASTHVTIPMDLSTLEPTGTHAAFDKLWGVLAEGCTRDGAGRQLVAGVRNYDVTLCDLIHNKLDFVFYPQQNSFTWRRRNEPVFDSLLWTVLVSVTVIILFSRVCTNLTEIVRDHERVFSWPVTIVAGSSTVLSYFAMQHNDFSTEERVLSLVLHVYVWVCIFLLLMHKCVRNGPHDSLNCIFLLLMHKCVRNGPHDSLNTTGALIAVLLLLTAHLQNTYETPFLSILVIIFGARSFLKFLNFALVHTQQKFLFVCYKLVILLCDTFVFLAVLELAVRSGARKKTEYAITAAGLILLSILGGVFLHSVVQVRRHGRQTKNKPTSQVAAALGFVHVAKV